MTGPVCGGEQGGLADVRYCPGSGAAQAGGQEEKGAVGGSRGD